MKRNLVLTLAILAVVALPVFAGLGNSGEKATGDVWFMNTFFDSPARAVFDFHEGINGRNPKGSMLYYDFYGNVFYAVFDVGYITSNNGRATFGGTVVYSNNPNWDGGPIQVWVLDDGTPGSEGDRIAAKFGPYSQVWPPPYWFGVLSGNLVVHPSN